jgi:hypothetical protein
MGVHGVDENGVSACVGGSMEIVTEYGVSLRME